MSDSARRVGRPPNRSHLPDASPEGIAEEAGIEAGHPVPDGLVAGRQRMERMQREEAERQAREDARQAAAPVVEVEIDEAGNRRRVTRENRKPFGSQNQKLFWPKREGYHRHWFNEHPGRIEEALAAGYTHVQDSQGRPVSRVVGRTDRGDGLRGYLMEIPQEWFAEDMKRNQDFVDTKAAGIKRGDLYGFDQSYLSSRTKVDDHSR